MAEEKKISRTVEKAVYPATPLCAAAIDINYIAAHAKADEKVKDWYIKYYEKNRNSKFPAMRKAYIEEFHKGTFKKKSINTGAMELLYKELKMN